MWLSTMTTNSGSKMTPDEINELSYQIETLKDDLEELQENHYKSQRDLREKSRMYDLLCRDFKKMSEKHSYLEESIRQRDGLIEEKGLLFVDGEKLLAPISTVRHLHGSSLDGESTTSSLSEKTVNGDGADRDESKYSVPSSSGTSGDIVNINEDDDGEVLSSTSQKSKQKRLCLTLMSRELVQLLNCLQGSTLEEKLKNINREKTELSAEIDQLRKEYEDEKKKNMQLQGMCQMYSNLQVNGSDNELVQAQRENNKLLYEYKFRLKKAEQEITSLQNNIARTVMQVERYKKQLEQAEKSEDELKADKRKILRDFREAQARIEELETANAHLQKRIDKLKNNRMAVIHS